MRYLFNWKPWAAAVAVAGLVVVAVTIRNNIAGTPPQPIGGAPALPSVQQQQLVVTDLQQMEKALGPFSTLPGSVSSSPDTGYPAVVLVRDDGSKAASQAWTVPFSTRAWTRGAIPQITAATVTGEYVTFATSTSGEFAYTIGVGQPFVLQDEPQDVMCFDARGMQWGISTTRAELLRRHV